MSSDDEATFDVNNSHKKLQSSISKKVNKSGTKVTILNQTILKAAKLGVRKDFLSNALNDSKNKFGSIDISQTNSAAKQEKLKKDKTIKEVISDSDTSAESENIPNNLNSKRSSSESSNSSDIEEEDNISRKTGDSSNNKAKSKQDVSSESSDSSTESKAEHKRKKQVNNPVKTNTTLEKNLKTKEDSDSSSSSSESDNKKPNTSKESKPKNVNISNKLLEEFIVNNKYEILETKDETFLDELSKDEEVYLLRMGKDIDPQLFLDKSISFTSPTKLKCKNDVFVVTVNDENWPAVNVINSNRLLNFKIKGNITIEQQYQEFNNATINLTRTYDEIDAPEKLKNRHPLFGGKYKKKIKLTENIFKKLEEAECDVRKTHKKKRKRKSRDHFVPENVESLDIFKLLNEHETQTAGSESKDKIQSHKKKRKRDKEDSDDFNIDAVQNEIESLIFQSFEKGKIAQENFTDHYNAVPKRKKKHKIKDEEKPLYKEKDDISLSRSFTGNNEEPNLIKEKKKECIRIANSTMMTPSVGHTILELDESSIPITKKDKSKHRRKSLDAFINDLMQDICSDSSITKKHKKKKKKNRSID